MAAPKKINLNAQESLTIIWDDGREMIIPLKLLRDESPDAGNKGETILWKHYPAPKSPDLPGKYEVQDIKMVGNYAIQIFWKDGNSDGLYSWNVLEEIFEMIEDKED